MSDDNLRVDAATVQRILFDADWSELETLLDTRSDVLLSDATDGVLAVIAFGYADARPFQERVGLIRTCLDEARCDRHDGVVRTLSSYFRHAFGEGGPYREPVKPDAPGTPRLFDDPAQQDLFEIVVAFAMSSSWWERRHIVSAFPVAFHSGRAEGMLRGMEESSNDPGLGTFYAGLRAVLERARTHGFEETFGSAPQTAFLVSVRDRPLLTLGEYRQLALLAFIECPAWERRREILERNKDVLFGDGLEPLLDVLFQRAPISDRTAIASGREVLMAARDRGIASAFREFLPAIQFKVGPLPASLPGEPADTETQAAQISSWRRMLHVTDRSLASWLWASTNLALARCLIDFPTLELHAIYEEEALLRLYDSLQVFARQNTPTEWSGVMEDLGRLYYQRTRGGRANNLETAIRCFQDALQVSQEAGAEDAVGRLSSRLASALFEREEGDRSANLHAAYAYAERALAVFQKRESRVDMVHAAQTLAVIVRERMDGDPAENVEHAIRLLAWATTQVTPGEAPLEWAGAHQKLAIAYVERGRADPDNHRNAILHLDEAQRVFNRAQFPRYWAAIEFSRGAAAFRLRGADPVACQDAYRHFGNALEVFKPDLFPGDRRRVLRNLAAVLFAEERWSDALRILEESISLGEYLEDIVATPKGRLAEIAALPDVYERLAFCLAKLGRYSDAFQALEAGKTRVLRKLVPVRESGVPDALQAALEAAVRNIQRLEPEIVIRHQPSAASIARDALVADSARRAALQELEAVKKEIAVARGVPVNDRLALEQLPALVPEGGALVAPLLTSRGTVVFVITGRHGISEHDLVWIDGVTDGNLRDLIDGTDERLGWLKAYGQWQQAIRALSRAETSRESPNNTQQLRNAREAHGLAVVEWDRAIDRTCRALWDLLGEPIYRALSQRVKTGSQIVLLPSKWLGLLPLHAAWRKRFWGRRYFIDDYVVTYAPSGYALALSKQRVAKRDPTRVSLLAVSNPTGDLRHAETEVEMIARQFPRDAVRILPRGEATPERLVGAAGGQTHYHFACHASFDWLNAPASGLLLANGARFTIRDVASRLPLDSVRLVTVSACESGISDHTRAPNEFVGLPAAFLQSGAAAVIGSLWAVDDAATSMLMRHFYESHIGGKLSPSEALRCAQMKVRRKSRTSHPYFWAAFQALGA